MHGHFFFFFSQFEQKKEPDKTNRSQHLIKVIVYKRAVMLYQNPLTVGTEVKNTCSCCVDEAAAKDTNNTIMSDNRGK